MKPLTLLTCTLPIIFLLTACGRINRPQLPNLPFVVTLSPESQISEAPQDTLVEPPAPAPSAQPSSTPFENTLQLLASPTPVETAGSTPTPPPTYIPYLPTATETLLPPLELPTEKPRAPALEAWTGLPTYPGDSEPGTLFRVDYDPSLWAQTTGNFGEIVLASRLIEYCTISPWTGRGLPVEWKVAHELRTLGAVTFEVNFVSALDQLKFVSYVGGDRKILTGFQVSFDQQSDQCLQAAETILATLRSFSANPTPTPSSSPEMTAPVIPATPTP